MSYHFSKEVTGDWESVKAKVTEALKTEGFGVLTHADIKETLKKKIDVDFRLYEILGACHPEFAHLALSAESHIGTLLPCNVVLQERENGKIEISAVDPVASMQAVNNDQLTEVAQEVHDKLQNVISSL